MQELTIENPLDAVSMEAISELFSVALRTLPLQR